MYQKITTVRSSSCISKVKWFGNPLFACPEARKRCPVSILDKYISKLPQDAISRDLFYVRPLEIIPTDPSLPWYSSVAVGKHTLDQRVKNMCSQAGISGKKTNHSLRATGVTRMFDKGAPEKLIQERTGHRSIKLCELTKEQVLLSTKLFLRFFQQAQMISTCKKSRKFRLNRI